MVLRFAVDLTSAENTSKQYVGFMASGLLHRGCRAVKRMNDVDFLQAGW
jgi:hypothetical protein